MPRCPDCGSDQVRRDTKHDESVCGSCGLVIEEDPEPTLARSSPSRGHATLKDRREGPKGRLGRIARIADRPSGSEHRLVETRREVARLAERLACPADVVERAVRIVVAARKARLTQGRDLDAVGAAALLASCRILFLTRTEAEVAAAARTDAGRIRSAYKSIVHGLGLRVPAMSAHKYMAQVASRLGVPAEVEGRARALLRPVCGTERAAGRNPLGWAAAALWQAAEHTEHAVSLNAAARAAEVSASTVKARVKELETLTKDD